MKEMKQRPAGPLEPQQEIDPIQLPGEGEILAAWLKRQAQGIPALEALGPVQLEELAPGPGWGLELCGSRLRTRITDLLGRTRLIFESAYTLRLRLPVPEGTGWAVPGPLLEYARRVDTAGQLTDPPPIGRGAFAAAEPRIGKTPAEDGLWEYRLGLVARKEEISQA